MEIFSALLAICAENSPVISEFPTQRPVTRNCDVFFDQRLNKRLNKQWWGWWFETPLRSLWWHCNVVDFREIDGQKETCADKKFSERPTVILTTVALHMAISNIQLLNIQFSQSTILIIDSLRVTRSQWGLTVEETPNTDGILWFRFSPLYLAVDCISILWNLPL